MGLFSAIGSVVGSVVPGVGTVAGGLAGGLVDTLVGGGSGSSQSPSVGAPVNPYGSPALYNANPPWFAGGVDFGTSGAPPGVGSRPRSGALPEYAVPLGITGIAAIALILALK